MAADIRRNCKQIHIRNQTSARKEMEEVEPETVPSSGNPQMEEEDASEPDTVPFFGIGQITFSPPSDVPLFSSRNDVDEATFFANYGSRRSRQIPSHWPTQESYERYYIQLKRDISGIYELLLCTCRLRSPHPLRVNNDRGCRWSWREFRLIQDEERFLESQNIPFTPGEYYARPFCPYLSFGLILRSLLVIVISCVVAAIIACLPSIYTARYLLQMTNVTPWTVIRKHPWYFTKVGQGLTLLFCIC